MNWLHIPPSQVHFTLIELEGWWLQSNSQFHGRRKEGWNTLVMLIWWLVWKERNARIFKRTGTNGRSLSFKVREEFKLWVEAGAQALQSFDTG